SQPEGRAAAKGRARIRVAADIGGTFTDITVLAEDGRLSTKKLPSTPPDYAEGVVRGLIELLDESGIGRGDIAEVLHGCTVATNAILEGRGARTALVTTRGFRDVLEIRRIRVPRLYDALYVKPTPLAPRDLRFEISERLDASGAVLTALAEDEIPPLVAALRAAKAEAVAVCFIHAYVNPRHEQIIGAALRRALPECFVTLSSEILPEIREYERTSTTVINAYVGPPVRRYIGSLVDRLKAEGIAAPLLVMQSGGGVLEAELVMDKPALIVECGPAAGVIGGLHVARTQSDANLITFDMGGTTAKASIIEEGRLARTDEYEVGGGISLSSRLVKGGGYALKTPVIDISEVGAGGGSVVWFDKVGVMKVGPQSTGAVPGPACYETGGTEATVTDANVVLGYVNPQALAGGSVPISSARARQVILEKVAERLRQEALPAAYGVFTIAAANMVRAVKAISTYRGRDPRDFALLAFGGNGGLFAAALAEALQTRRVVIPPAAGVFSAIGLLASDMELTSSNTYLCPFGTASVAEIASRFERLSQEVEARLGGRGIGLRLERAAMLRYRGQAFELPVKVPDGPVTAATIDLLSWSFGDEHERVYGHRMTADAETEFVSLAVTGASTPADKPTLSARTIGNAQATQPGSARRAYFGAAHGERDTPVIDRFALGVERRAG
ncbi:MAG: hydantoinase/oxoprolinase family protein, partial [Alphaproteobacteria bacterium]|nr:hydantoinase/oxoprolinase family protein [Alphaproteobacteria bacterium]